MSTWYKYVKKYAWDDTATPYMTRVGKLTQQQADKEIFIYALFLGILFAVVSLASIAGTRLQPGDPSLVTGLGGIQRAPHSFAIAFYAATILFAAIALAVLKHPYAATYCGSAPVAAFFYVLADRMPGELTTLDKGFLFSLIFLWGWYSLRVTAIARAYLSMPPTAPPGEPAEDSLGVPNGPPPRAIFALEDEEPPGEAGSGEPPAEAGSELPPPESQEPLPRSSTTPSTESSTHKKS